MAKGNKCGGCLQRKQQAQSRLANRKDWEIKAKEADKEKIIYWEEKYNNPKEITAGDPFCYCAYDILPTGSPGIQRSCNKCNDEWYVGGNEYKDFPPDDHVCNQKKCEECGHVEYGRLQSLHCPNCGGKKKKERERLELESHIRLLQNDLKRVRAIAKAKGLESNPAYIENVKNIKKQLIETREKYKSKFGELPSSLRDDVREDVGGGVKTPPKVERVMFRG